MRVTAPPVACSMAAQCSIGIAPRIFQLPTAAADTPSMFASVKRPPASRAAVSSKCSERGLMGVFMSIAESNTFSVYKSTPRDELSSVQSQIVKTIGERIRQARNAVGISGERLAAKVGYKNQSAIGNLENRRDGTGGNKLSQIAKALNVSVDWLMNGPDCDQVPFLPSSVLDVERADMKRAEEPPAPPCPRRRSPRAAFFRRSSLHSIPAPCRVKEFSHEQHFLC